MAAHLVHVDFPPYVLKCVDETHFMVAGGGGPVRSGVPNALEVFQLQRQAGRLIAESKLRLVTDHGDDRSAIMNAALRFDGKEYLLAAGQDDRCKLYQMRKSEKPKVEDTPTDPKGDAHVKRRKKKTDSGKDESTDKSKRVESVPTEVFSIERLNSCQTNFSEKENYQKAVCFTPNGLFFVTGGTDGHVRLWSYPSMTKQLDIEAHTKEVDDIIINPVGNKIVSAGRDCLARVWHTKDGSHICDLQWNGCKDTKQYRYKACRFGFLDGDPTKSALFTIHIPAQQKKGQHSYLCKWNDSTFKPSKTVSAGTEILSALAISHSGHFIGVGTMTGSVGVYVAFNLQRIKWVQNHHSIFVTGLSFVPMTHKSRAILGDLDTAVMSISADQRVGLVTVDNPRNYPVWLVFVGAFFLIVLIFALLAAVGTEV
ncbi:Prolactin regulatory element-binding protein [Holothuria leucospilota]|uniref:Prolactin regulatory element-binding protein n=1 Tax=Holothuria leucospilota TaxID=206669 RepID=A0A9Q1BUV1_HOLLE|nr:Prolactin regulatory element-binding protein [Holothuria leucospilota]